MYINSTRFHSYLRKRPGFSIIAFCLICEASRCVFHSLGQPSSFLSDDVPLILIFLIFRVRMFGGRSGGRDHCRLITRAVGRWTMKFWAPASRRWWIRRGRWFRPNWMRFLSAWRRLGVTIKHGFRLFSRRGSSWRRIRYVHIFVN